MAKRIISPETDSAQAFSSESPLIARRQHVLDDLLKAESTVSNVPSVNAPLPKKKALSPKKKHHPENRKRLRISLLRLKTVNLKSAKGLTTISMGISSLVTVFKRASRYRGFTLKGIGLSRRGFL